MGVPDGYFDNLKTRLESIPSSAKAVSAGPWARVRPYLAMAAGFAAILLAGNAILRGTASLDQASGSNPYESSYAELIALTNPESIYNALEYDPESISDEDIINYLIETGARPEQFAYSGDEQ